MSDTKDDRRLEKTENLATGPPDPAPRRRRRNTLYECEICDYIDPSADNLCLPLPIESRRGDPRPLAEKLDLMCQGTRDKVAYSCERCGRPASSAMFVCRARPLE
jgi:hypothetical protein